jgi:hypothetical protein
MKSTIQRVLFAAAVVTLGAGALGTASAQTTTTPAAAPSSAPGANPQQGRHHGFHHFGGSPFVGTLLRATQQLNLTVTQQASIKAILKSAHETGGEHQGPELTVVGDPAHPDFAAAVQSAATGASARVQKESTLAGQIYGVLTSQQQKQLPTVLAAMQAKQAARRAAWAAQHPNSNG